MNPNSPDDQWSKVSETLLIPLYFRALECKEPEPMVRDEKAPVIVERMHYHFTRFEKAALDRVFTMMRAREFDRSARAFLEQHPASVVVEIGCGLDDWLSRVDNGTVEWYNLDLPEVIAVRTELLGEEGRGRAIACSALDPAWLKQVRPRPVTACLFLAEGVLPYFEESEVRRFILMLDDQYPGSELVFDALSPFLVWIQKLEPGTKGAASLIRWTCRTDRELEHWREGLRLLGSWDYFSQREPRLGWASFMRYFAPLARCARVLHYQLGKPGDPAIE
jgi:O-methyltransferase involved in polyketide biosynthesis